MVSDQRVAFLHQFCQNQYITRPLALRFARGTKLDLVNII